MLEVMRTLFDGVWALFTNTTVPGFGVKLSVVAIGFFLMRLSLLAISVLTGFRSNISDKYRTSKEKASAYKNLVERIR